MIKLLAGLFSADILAMVFLVAIGVLIFVLIRPGEEDAAEDLKLSFLKQVRTRRDREDRANLRSGERKPEGGNESPSEGPAGSFGL